MPTIDVLLATALEARRESGSRNPISIDATNRAAFSARRL
jgi:hypothetical protein